MLLTLLLVISVLLAGSHWLRETRERVRHARRTLDGYRLRAQMAQLTVKRYKPTLFNCAILGDLTMKPTTGANRFRDLYLSRNTTL